MFCLHRWKVVETKVLPSLLEQMVESGVTKLSGGGDPAYKPAIVTYRCEKCGTEKVQRI